MLVALYIMFWQVRNIMQDMDNSNLDSHDSNTNDEGFESEVAKVEVGDNFVIISNELENGDPFYVIRHDMNAKQHLKMIGETLGMQVRCSYAVYGTIMY